MTTLLIKVKVKDESVESAEIMINYIKSKTDYEIEIMRTPTDEEIIKETNFHKEGKERSYFMAGAKWMLKQITR